ncbi:MAG: hypothetical protein DCC73_11345 [Proteobacteria bacterium]|nr:MAG: hypothetical protein DCC73_11345 [Pseudomonadota bacterium]
MNERSPLPAGKERFKRSGRLTWAALWSINIEVALITIWPSAELVQVLVVAIPIQGGLAAAWSGITNWAEVRR